LSHIYVNSVLTIGPYFVIAAINAINKLNTQKLNFYIISFKQDHEKSANDKVNEGELPFV